jgi:hypothetical protein
LLQIHNGLTTNGVVITDAIKFVQTNKEKLTMSTKEEDNSKESEEPDYDEDKDQLEEEQEEETGELDGKQTTNKVFLMFSTNQRESPFPIILNLQT